MVVMLPQPYRRMVHVLWDFEGRRCLWRLPVAAGLWLAVPALGLAGPVAGIYIGASLHFTSVLVGAAVSVGSPVIAAALWRRKPWRSVVARRLWTYEAPAPATGVPVLVRSEHDVSALEKAIRRAHFNPMSTVRIGRSPEDAPDLRMQVWVEEPERWKRSSSDADRVILIAETLRRARIRARVAGLDVLP